MKSVKDGIKRDLRKLGIESSTKEKCNVCNYGMKITIVVDGKETSHCKYCNDKELAKELDLPMSEEDSKRRKIQAKANYFTRIPNDLKNPQS